MKTLSPGRLKKLLFHRALEGTWEQFFILAAKQWNLCFQLHLSLLLFQQTIKAKLKEDWGKNCRKTVLHWPRGSRESHRSFPPLFSAVFIEEDSWLLFYSKKHHSASLHLLLGCPEVGVVEEISLKVSQVEHYQTKEENLTVRCLFNCCSHPHFICVCPHKATKLNSADTSVLEELDRTF